MKNKILSYVLGGFLMVLLNFFTWYIYADCAQDCAIAGSAKDECIKECEAKKTEGNQEEKKCNGIKLNTNFPIIWNCISTGNKTDATSVFPTMIWALTKIAMSLIFIVCFILVIVGGIMWAWDKPKEGQKLITKVAITILLLWFSGVILRLINPNFFG